MEGRPCSAQRCYAPARTSTAGSAASPQTAFGEGTHHLVHRARLLAAQANLWTKYIADEKTVEYMPLPRLAKPLFKT